ncbi:MAG: FAD/NAD(P)-binding protein [Candidatus Eremiobacteraeota bacterium]|nr:FAD/NAD(P)-binding protein [Candidatus Eremiobacteraeota bacterium]
MTDTPIDAAIIGAGVAGSAVTLALAARAPAGFRTLIFDRAEPGPGTAYAPQSASLLLNGPVRAMSMMPDDERHFERWLVDEPSDALICRARYGAYARATVASALASRADFRHVRDEVVDLQRRDDNGYALTTHRGERFVARKVVLALGNFAPASHFLPETLQKFPGYFGDPWRVDVAPFENRDVVVIGSRLTAMDVVALLDERAFRGRVHLVSRHALIPRVEDPRVRGADPAKLGLDTSTPYALLRSMRRAAETFPGDWRSLVDSVRPMTPAIWASWSDRERKRFLRHAQAMWAVHRYRVPAATFAAFARLQHEGRVLNHRGRIRRVTVRDSELDVDVSSAAVSQTIRAAYVVNCTGPSCDIRRVDRPLVRNALSNGLLRADSLHLGIDANEEYRILDASGRAQSNLFGIGPLLRGLWYETTAIPEIVKHASSIAAELLREESNMAVAG